MAKVPHWSEDELPAKLEAWLATLRRPPTLAELIEGDGDLFTAFTLKAFRRAARKAVLSRLEDEGASFDLSPEELGNAAMRVFAGLARAWELSHGEQAALLDLGASLNVERVGRKSEADLPIGIIERATILLNIFEAINILLPEPGMADAWMRSANSEPFFAGRTPLAVMTTGLEELLRVERFLLAERWGN